MVLHEEEASAFASASSRTQVQDSVHVFLHMNRKLWGGLFVLEILLTMLEIELRASLVLGKHFNTEHPQPSRNFLKQSFLDQLSKLPDCTPQSL